MKRILFVLALLPVLLAAACTKADDDTLTTPLDELPPATQVGANTFGCLINGVPFVNQGGGLSVQNINANYSNNPSRLFVNAFDYSNGSENARIVSLRIYDPEINGSVPPTSWTCIVMRDGGEIEYSIILDSYNIEISRFEDNIAAGTFDMKAISNISNTDTLTVTNGRFDVIYFE